MYDPTPIPVIAEKPPLNELVELYVAGHDQRWTFGKLIDPDIWEIDSRELPSHVAVDSELVTHWRPEPPSPLDFAGFFARNNPFVIDAPPSKIEAARRKLPTSPKRIKRKL